MGVRPDIEHHVSRDRWMRTPIFSADPEIGKGKGKKLGVASHVVRQRFLYCTARKTGSDHRRNRVVVDTTPPMKGQNDRNKRLLQVKQAITTFSSLTRRSVGAYKGQMQLATCNAGLFSLSTRRREPSQSVYNMRHPDASEPPQFSGNIRDVLVLMMLLNFREPRSTEYCAY